MKDLLSFFVFCQYFLNATHDNRLQYTKSWFGHIEYSREQKHFAFIFHLFHKGSWERITDEQNPLAGDGGSILSYDFPPPVAT